MLFRSTLDPQCINHTNEDMKIKRSKFEYMHLVFYHTCIIHPFLKLRRPGWTVFKLSASHHRESTTSTISTVVGASGTETLKVLFGVKSVFNEFLSGNATADS